MSLLKSLINDGELPLEEKASRVDVTDTITHLPGTLDADADPEELKRYLRVIKKSNPDLYHQITSLD